MGWDRKMCPMDKPGNSYAGLDIDTFLHKKKGNNYVFVGTIQIQRFCFDKLLLLSTYERENYKTVYILF